MKKLQTGISSEKQLDLKDEVDNAPEAQPKINPEKMDLRFEQLHKRQRIEPGGGANSV